MPEKATITQKRFEMLLGWLDPNREMAGQKYEKIRQRLIRIFICRGCFEAEEMADETINRVALKLPQIIGNYYGEPVLYFRGVANRIHLEWLRKQKKIKNLKYTETEDACDEEEPESEYECLEACLKTLPAQKRKFITEYYQGEKSEKIRHRKEMRKKLGISNTALQVRASRIRANLKQCVENCMAQKGE